MYLQVQLTGLPTTQSCNKLPVASLHRWPSTADCGAHEQLFSSVHQSLPLVLSHHVEMTFGTKIGKGIRTSGIQGFRDSGIQLSLRVGSSRCIFALLLYHNCFDSRGLEISYRHFLIPGYCSARPAFTSTTTENTIISSVDLTAQTTDARHIPLSPALEARYDPRGPGDFLYGKLSMQTSS